MKLTQRIILLIILTSFTTLSCIKDDILDDYVAPKLSITNKIQSLTKDVTYKLETRYTNSIGTLEEVNIIWKSSNETIVAIGNNGMVTGVEEGTATITASYNDLSDSFNVNVNDFTIDMSGDTIADTTNVGDTIMSGGGATIRTGTLSTTSSYAFQGTFKLEEISGDVILTLNSDFMSTDQLPGLVIYLTNNPATNNEAFEVGPVTNFSGENIYNLGSSVGINEYSYVLGYCKPFSVKVGDGPFDN